MENAPVETRLTDEPAPFWTKVGSPRPGNEEGDRVAILDLYDPAYVPIRQCVTEDEIAALRENGLDENGAYALRHNFGAGTITDLQEVALQAISNGGFAGVQTLPNTDSGPRQTSACPYLSGMFGKDPKDIDLLSIGQLSASPSPAFIHLMNERGRQMRLEEKRMCEHGRYHHFNLRKFKLDALAIAFDEMGEEERTAFDAYWKKHASDGDRLLDYATTFALQEKLGKRWDEWPEDIVTKKPIDLIADDAALGEAVQRLLYTQWKLGEQWDGYTQALKAIGGHHVEDRAYAVMPGTPEVWRDWREQYVEGKPGIFHIGQDKKSDFRTGANVAGDPYGAQAWNHVVAKYAENPDGVIDYIVETVAQDEGRVDIRRIDHALAWIWKYYRIPKGKEATQGEYVHALKEKIFNRLRTRFPDINWIIEDVGFTDYDVLSTQKWLGLGPFKCVKWAPDPKTGELSGHYASPDDAPFPAVVLDDNADLKAFEVWFYQLKQENKRTYLAQIYGTTDVEERFRRHVIQGERHEVEAVLRWIFRSRAHIAITTLQSAGNAVVEDDREENVPGGEHPQFWQLKSRLTREELPEVFAMTKRIIDGTRRNVRNVLGDGALQVLALSQRPGEGQYVNPGGTYSLRIACNRPPQADTRVELRAQNGELNPATITECTRYKEGTFVWTVTATVPENALSWKVFDLRPSIEENGTSHSLCMENEMLHVQVDGSMPQVAV